jgi:hypothetical protein
LIQEKKNVIFNRNSHVGHLFSIIQSVYYCMSCDNPLIIINFRERDIQTYGAIFFRPYESERALEVIFRVYAITFIFTCYSLCDEREGKKNYFHKQGNKIICGVSLYR